MTPSHATLDSLLINALPFMSTHCDETVDNPDQILSKLLHESSSLASTARLEPFNPTLSEFLHRCVTLLTRPTTRPLLRKSAANSDQICSAVFHCLKAVLDEHLGPQNLIDVLRIIQMITYERINFSDWVDELLPFLTKQILETKPSELLPYCMCILCNLVSKSKLFTTRFMQMESFKSICARILQLLTHNSKAVVVSALVLVGYLDEKSRDTVYSHQNIAQTFLCIFNILSSASPANDVLMTTHFAADLLHRLVISQPKSPNDLPLLNAIARNLTTYDFFDKSIQKTAALLNLLDPRSEESQKIFHLLLSFCQVDELRGPTIAALVAVEPSELRLSTPAHAILGTARLSFEEAIFPEVPLTALQLFTFVIKESVEAGKGIRRIFSSSDALCALIRQTVGTVRIDLVSPLAPFHTKQMAETLRMSESLANDEDFRPELLEILHAQLCADLFDQHLRTNPIVNHWLFNDTDLLFSAHPIYSNECTPLTAASTSAASAKGGPSLPLWSINAVPIPIQLMRLLASLKDHSKAHKELYWRSLKDHRLLPFMAYAIARGNSALVHDALVLFTHCAQIHNFSLKRLSILIAKCASLKHAASRASAAPANGQQPASNTTNHLPSFIASSFDQQHHNVNNHKNICPPTATSKEGREQRKLVTQLEGDGFEANEVLKLSSAAAHSLNGAGGGGGTVTDDDIGSGGAMPTSADENVRRFVNELEHRVVESDAEIAALNSEKNELTKRVEQLEQLLGTERDRHTWAMGNVRKERQMLAEENEQERALHAVMRGKFDEMKRKLDTVAITVFDKQAELEQMVKDNEELKKRFDEHTDTLEKHRTELETAKQMVTDREIELDKSERELARYREDNNRLSLLRQQMQQLLQEFDAAKSEK